MDQTEGAPQPDLTPRRTARIELALPVFTLRSRSVGVAHSDADLSRGLELGEHVLLHDPATRTHYTGLVADIDFSASDTHYRIQLGTRITAAEATQWLEPEQTVAHGGLTTGDVARLLASLRHSQKNLLEAYRSYVADERGR